MKLTFSAMMFFGLAAALFQGAPAHAQTLTPGSTFKVVATPNENQANNALDAASASASNDIWAVGQSTIHFDGAKWTAFPAPLIKGNNTAVLKGVVDISPTSAWAVGFTSGNNPLEQIIERWDGTKWKLFPNPKLPPNSEATLFAMASTSANDIWAVGDFVENDTNLDFNLFEHWDGNAWTATTVQVARDSFESLSGASADASNDAWAVGFQGLAPKILAKHWDGANWTTVATPRVAGNNNRLNAVLALAPNDAWAVGFSTPRKPQNAATLTLILHWDGTSWKVVPSPNVGPKSQFQSNTLLGLTANSANDIWAFGSYLESDGSGQQKTLLLHWDGTSWKITTSPDPTKGGFLFDSLQSGVSPSPGNVWIFGGEGEFQNNHGIETLALHTTTGK